MSLDNELKDRVLGRSDKIKIIRPEELYELKKEKKRENIAEALRKNKTEDYRRIR